MTARRSVRFRETSYDFVQSSSVPALWVCQSCGAMVGDYPKHGVYHGALDMALQRVVGFTLAEMINPRFRFDGDE